MAVTPASLYRFFKAETIIHFVKHRARSVMSAITQDCTSRDIEPARPSVLHLLGIPSDADLRSEVTEMFDRAFDLFHRSAEPRGISESVTREEFAAIHAGDGRNDPDTPLVFIYPRADDLALFAVTLGDRVSEEIRRLFAENDFAFATIFDAVASEGAELLADVVMQNYREMRNGTGGAKTGSATLRYSPGYCGWHVSGQHALFPRLRPEQIGIELLESSLMKPSKSISGVFVTGSAQIHKFVPDYPFCSDCTTKSCRDRIAELDTGNS
ncbi:vitamin B12 dependent-methionine synthase activation domain-containing protein [Candidatus Zixiibacteriota bacterium]